MFSLKDSDDEDDLFAPNASKNLENLFNVSMQQKETVENPSLKYVAPKQSTTKSSNIQKQEPAVENKLIIAKRVNAYKLINKQYTPAGLLGIALIKLNISRYRIILYKDKQNIISTYDILENHTLSTQDLYCYYTDNSLNNWSVLFENEECFREFTNELKNAGVEIVINDIIMKEEEKATISDKIIISDKSNENCDIKDTKAKILTLMEKMGQTKLLPEIQSSPVDNTTDSSDTENVKKPSKPLIKPRKLDTRSISNKPNISHNIISPTQYILNSGQVIPFSQDTVSNMQNITSTALNTTNQQWVSPANIIPASSSNDSLNMYICENRMHNSELRMNVSRLETKLEKILDKLDRCGKPELGTINDGSNLIIDFIKGQTERHNYEIDALKSQLKRLEIYGDKKELSGDTSNLRDTITKQQQEILDYKKQINILELKLNDFTEFYKEKKTTLEKYQENNKYKNDQETLIETKSSNLLVTDSKINNTNNSKDSDELNNLQFKCEEKDEQIKNYEKIINDLNSKLKNFEGHATGKDVLIEELKNKLQATENENISLKQEIEKFNQTLTLSKSNNEALKNQLEYIQSEADDNEKRINDMSNSKVKTIMNEIFSKLTKELDENEMYNSEQVILLCKRTIKSVTLEALTHTNISPPPPPDFDG